MRLHEWWIIASLITCFGSGQKKRFITKCTTTTLSILGVVRERSRGVLASFRWQILFVATISFICPLHFAKTARMPILISETRVLSRREHTWPAQKFRLKFYYRWRSWRRSILIGRAYVVADMQPTSLWQDRDTYILAVQPVKKRPPPPFVLCLR